MFMLTTALMLGTAGLPHVIVRFFTVPTVRDARVSAGWALVFIAIMYTTISSVAAFSRVNLIKNLQNVEYKAFVNGELKHADGTPNDGNWFKTWENAGLLAWNDRNGDGKSNTLKVLHLMVKKVNQHLMVITELKMDTD